MKKIEFIFRSLIPFSLKKIFYIFREIFISYSELNKRITPLHLDQELLTECSFCENRRTMIDFLPKNAIVAELGTEKGIFAQQIIKRASPIELHLCDVNFTSFNDQNIKSSFAVTKHEKRTVDFLNSFEDDFFDWIYIDAGHQYNDVVKDINAAKNKVKKGGLLVFNDFAHIHPNLGRLGVMQAVSEFINKERWKVRFFAFNHSALYDIAIQRPC